MTSTAGPAEEAPSVDRIEPGEQITISYVIADDWEHGDCFPVGEYRFAGMGLLGIDGDEAEPVQFEWGFTIEIV